MLVGSSPRGESGRQLLARLSPRPELRSVLTELCPRLPTPGDVIEISGPCEWLQLGAYYWAVGDVM